MSIIKWQELERERPNYEKIQQRLKDQSTAKKYVVSYKARRFFSNKSTASLFASMIKSGAELTQINSSGQNPKKRPGRKPKIDIS
ncbi:MAG: hypothetical protein JXQ96_05165 [Cyclobacteriaceae bacterium]